MRREVGEGVARRLLEVSGLPPIADPAVGH